MEKNPRGPASRQEDILPDSCCADLFTEFTHAVFSTLGLNVSRGVCVRVWLLCVSECVCTSTSVGLDGCCGPGLGDPGGGHPWLGC